MARPKKNDNENIESAVDTAVDTVEKNDDVEIKVTRNQNKAMQIDENEEIQIESLIPNVDYYDEASYNNFSWGEVGHIEYIPFGIVNNIWRNHRGYFVNLWIRPLDERVIKKFRLDKTYEKYDFVLDKENYTRDNVDKIFDIISSMPNSSKISIINKIKAFVMTGEVTDVSVLVPLGRKLDVDFVNF